MNIDKDKLRRARRVLGTRTDTDAVEKALDMVLSNAEIEQAIQSVFGQVAGFKVS